MNKTTKTIADWLASEKGLTEFLREIAEGDEFEYGDTELGVWISDLLGGERNGIWWDVVTSRGVDVARLTAVRDGLTEGRDRFAWLDEMDSAQIRQALLVGVE